ncbi:MAG TPA: polysaccharide deacetylase family protein, partial [Anaerolineae bacterium]
TVTATDTAGNSALLTGSFTSIARNVDICTWKDCKQSAASWSDDDGNNNCRADLEAAGFRGTYYYNGNTTQDWFATYSAAGHEIGSHTVSHLCYSACCGGSCTLDSLWQCPFTQDDVTAYRQNQFEPNIDAIEAGTGKPVVTGAWPCGCTDSARMTAASAYLLAERGYNDCGCGFTQDINNTTPAEFMNMNGLHAYDQTFIDRAINEGKWAIVTSHGLCDGISYIGSRQDVLWAAPVGEITKYIKVRDAARLSNYARSGRTISFDAMHTLATFQRQRVDGTSMTPILYDNPVTLKVHILDTDSVLSVQNSNTSLTYTVKTIDGARYVLFDMPLDTQQHVMITLALPAPSISQVINNSPVELGAVAQITALVSIEEGVIQAVTLHVLAPGSADIPMSPAPETTGVYKASFTPSQVATYTYQVLASNSQGNTSLSPIYTLTARDTTPPAWRAQHQTHDTIGNGQANNLSVQAMDLQGLQRAILSTNESGTWQEYDWPSSNWWDHRWPHRRVITVTEPTGLDRTSDVVDVAISAEQFPGLTDCAGELRVADTTRNEIASQTYGQTTTGGVLSCHLLFETNVGANASRNYYVYYGYSAPPAYVSDLRSATSGNVLNVRSNWFDLDLSTDAGIVSRVRLPNGSNVNLPLSPRTDTYWGWHQVCATGDGLITGKSNLCNGSGSTEASGLLLTATIDGPILKEYVFTSVKSTATYVATFRFFANTPYYQYVLTRTGGSVSVMNNFWYSNGNFDRITAGAGGTPFVVYNLYSNGADQVRIASLSTIDYGTIDGSYNDGTDLGGLDYRYPSAGGLALYVTTGNTQQLAQGVVTQLNTPVNIAIGSLEDAPLGMYGSPLELAGANGWIDTGFNWQNPALPNGAAVQWRITLCDISQNCSTTNAMVFNINPPPPPQPLPASFYGEVHFLDGAPSVGDPVQVWVAGVTAPFSTQISNITGTLTYQYDVPGDIAGTLPKEGGVAGDVITLSVAGRV